jgi:DNA-binding NtrC family response regulator
MEDANVLLTMLGGISVPLQHVENLARARQRLDHEHYGVILTEARFSDGNWEDVVQLVERQNLSSAVVVTDRLADARFWADALDLGAYDVLAQPFCCAEVQRVVTNALTSPAELRSKAYTAL